MSTFDDARALQSQEPTTKEEVPTTGIAGTNEPEPPKDDLFSPKFAALTRKERELRERQRLFEEREAEFIARESSFKELDELKGKNPLEWLEKNGVDFEETARRYLNNGEPAPEDHTSRLEKEINSLKERLEAQDKAAREREENNKKEEQSKAISEYKKELNTMLKDNESQYKYIGLFDASEMVFDAIVEKASKDGTMPDMGEIASGVESYLSDYAGKLREAEKSGEPKQSSEVKEEGALSKFSTTLSNKMSSDVPPSEADDSPEARWKRALAKL